LGGATLRPVKERRWLVSLPRIRVPRSSVDYPAAGRGGRDPQRDELFQQ